MSVNQFIVSIHNYEWKYFDLLLRRPVGRKLSLATTRNIQPTCNSSRRYKVKVNIYMKIIFETFLCPSFSSRGKYSKQYVWKQKLVIGLRNSAKRFVYLYIYMHIAHCTCFSTRVYNSSLVHVFGYQVISCTLYVCLHILRV